MNHKPSSRLRAGLFGTIDALDRKLVSEVYLAVHVAMSDHFLAAEASICEPVDRGVLHRTAHASPFSVGYPYQYDATSARD